MPKKRQRGRPRIGPKVDFRVPEEVDAEITRQAENLGIPVDEHYRNIVVSGISR